MPAKPKAAPSPAATMDLVGGDPCLDFVNSVGGRVPATDGAPYRVRDDKLRAYSDLVAFAAHAGLVDASVTRGLLRRSVARPREARRTLERARAFREALYGTLVALRAGRRPASEELHVLNAELGACRSHQQLASAGRGLRWSWRAEGGRLESPLWPLVAAAAALLTSPELARVGRCGDAACRWMFLDKSRNHSRQWCTMKACGNLSKVRRFRQRRTPRPR